MKPGALIAGKYRLTKPIGKGAMGTVWEATHEGTSRQVAVKLILEPTDELRQRLVREARAYGALRHRNIVEVLDVGQTDEGDPFLVMQLLVGETLGDRLVRQRRLAVPEAARIARDVARALAAAHAASIIHRDLKPANIFLHDEPGEDATVIKVVDFGVSKNLLASDGLSTIAGGMVGSPAYMSPEQAAAGARGPVDHRADLWSLGVLLFEMLTGVRPLQGDANTIIPRIVSAEIPLVTRFVRTVDPRLAALVARCLERDLARRVGSAAELAVQLQDFTTASAGSGSAPFAQTPSVTATAAPRSDASGIASPRAPLASAPERDPSGRPPRPQSGHVLIGPTMPGASDDEGEEQATAKLTPGVLHALRPAAPPPKMSPLAGRTVPMQSDPALSVGPPARVIPRDPASAPSSFKTTLPLSNEATFGSGLSWAPPAPTTAKLEPVRAWSPEQQVTGRGTMRMAPDPVGRLADAPGLATLPLDPPAAPPLESGTWPSPASSTAPLLRRHPEEPAPAGEASAPQTRQRAARLAVGAALTTLVLVGVGVKLLQRPARAGAEITTTVTASVVPAVAVAVETSSAAAPAIAAPVPSTLPSALPSPPVEAVAIAPPPPPAVKPAPAGSALRGKQAPPSAPAPSAKPASKLPGFLQSQKKFNPAGP